MRRLIAPGARLVWKTLTSRNVFFVVLVLCSRHLGKPIKTAQSALNDADMPGILLDGVYRSRHENLERARAHEAAGNTAAAYECYQKAVDITPETAASFLKVWTLERGCCGTWHI